MIESIGKRQMIGPGRWLLNGWPRKGRALNGGRPGGGGPTGRGLAGR